MNLKLSQAGKEELALAILLWKDFKSSGKVDLNFKITKQALEFADKLGIRKEFDDLLSKVPVFDIKFRD